MNKGQLTPKINLSPRLEAVAAMVPAGSRPLDIGTDHAYLPLALVAGSKCPIVIASDINEAPLAVARRQVWEAGLERTIDLRKGNGLDVISPGEADVIICAGMGGHLIINLLMRGGPVLQEVRRLVLQPNVRIAELRKWLADNCWSICDEDLVRDNGRYYHLIAAEPGRMQLTEPEAELGPVLIKKKHPLIEPYIRIRLNALETALQELKKASRPCGEKVSRFNQLKWDLEQILTGLKQGG